MGLSLVRMMLLMLMLSPALGQQISDQISENAAVEAADAAQKQLLRDSALSLQARLDMLTEDVGAFDVSLAELQLDLGRVYLELE